MVEADVEEEQDSSAPDPADRLRRAVRLSALSGLTLAAAGLLSMPSIRSYELANLSIFYDQFARIEGPSLAIVAALSIALLVMLRREPEPTTEPESILAGLTRRPSALILALAVLVVAVVGTDLIFHRFLLADDEYSAWFQAVIFSRGKWNAVVPAEWCKWIEPLTPTTIARPQPCTWHLAFLPVHSLIRAVFLALHIDRFAGPVTAAVSVLLLDALCRRVWPDRPMRRWIAVLVLVSSTQFLVMSMTMYAMPTHLMFSLLWLWLYVVDSRWSLAMLPWVGAIALGVHSPFPHLLLVPPFIFRWVRNKRFGITAYVGAVYVLAIVYWRSQLEGAASAAPTVAAVGATSSTISALLSRAHIPSFLDNFTSVMNLALVATWNIPIAVIGTMAAILTWRRLDTFSRDSALSLACIVVGRAISYPQQGEGWGYRFIYAGLGSLAMLSACGLEVIAEAVGARRAKVLFLSSVAVAVLVELPMRGVQVRGIIDPYYRGYQYLVHQPAKVVLFPASAVAWGRQLVRNDPFLRDRPLLMELPVGAGLLPVDCASATMMTQAAPNGALTSANAASREAVCRALRGGITSPAERELRALYPGEVSVVTADDLVRLGIPRVQSMQIVIRDAKQRPGERSGARPAPSGIR